MIDGVVASSYNTMLGSEANMHAVTAAGRLLYRVAPSLFRYVHAKRAAEPVSLAIGGVASKVHRLACTLPLQCTMFPADRMQPLHRLQYAICSQPSGPDSCCAGDKWSCGFLQVLQITGGMMVSSA